MLTIKRLFIIVFLVLFYSCNMEKKEKYKVLTPEEMISFFENEKGVVVDQLDYNKAIIEKLNDGNYLIVASGMNKGMVVYDKKMLDSMIATKKFPKETDPDNFYIKYQSQVDCIEDEISFFNDLFFKHTGLNFDFDLSESFIEKADNMIRDFRQSKQIDEIIPVFTILICESFRREIGGKWVFKTEYSLNTYKTLIISDQQGVLLDQINKLLLEEFLKRSNPDLKSTMIHLVFSYVNQKVNRKDFNDKEFYTSLRSDFKTNFKKYLNIASHPRSSRSCKLCECLRLRSFLHIIDMQICKTPL